MTKNVNEIYRCNICGNIVEVINAGVGDFVCCGQPMILQKENTKEASFEKHIPVIEKTATGIKVRVGSVSHPMEEKHFIQWIEVLTDDKNYRIFLKPGDQPEAEFCLEAKNIVAREYCNLHGHWKS